MGSAELRHERPDVAFRLCLAGQAPEGVAGLHDHDRTANRCITGRAALVSIGETGRRDPDPDHGQSHRGSGDADATTQISSARPRGRSRPRLRHDGSGPTNRSGGALSGWAKGGGALSGWAKGG